MKRLMFIISLLPLLISLLLIKCNVSQEHRMIQSIEKNIRDLAFKKNEQIKLLEIKNIRYREISEKEYQTLIVSTVNSEIDVISNFINSKQAQAKNHLKQAELYAYLGSEILRNNEIEEGRNEMNTAKEILERLEKLANANERRANNLNMLDSIRVKYYKVTVDIKSTVGDSNFIDSLIYVMDKGYSIQNARDSFVSIDLSKYH